MSEIVKLKEYPRPGNLGLGNQENGSRSKFPNTYDMIQPSIGRDGRYITGLDENALSVNKITDSKERESTKESIRKEREQLEALTGYDLSGKSTFWSTYFVVMDSKKTFDLSNPEDKIAYLVITSNGEAAPTLREAREGTIQHRTSKFYIARENEDVSEKVANKRKYNEAIVAFTKLMDDQEKSVLIGRYLNLPITEATPHTNVFDHFQTFLDRDNELGSVDKFLMAMKKTPEQIQLKMIYDDAVKYKVIRIKDGLYQRGNITFGKNPKEVLDNLGDPKFSGEVISIQEEIELKRKFG